MASGRTPKPAKVSGIILWCLGWPLWMFVIGVTYLVMRFTSTPVTFREAHDFLRDITFGRV